MKTIQLLTIIGLFFMTILTITACDDSTSANSQPENPESKTWITQMPALTTEIIPFVDISSPKTVIDTQTGSGQIKTDAQLVAELKQALISGGIIVFNAHGITRTIKLVEQLYIPVQGTAPNYDAPVILDGGHLITLDGGSDQSGNGGTRILEKAWKVNLTVQRMAFQNANAANITSGHPDDNAGGGAINIENWDGSLTVINCSFINCHGKSSGPDIGGGAVNCPGQKQVKFSQCTFTNCSGSNGGAINSIGSEMWLLNCNFINCFATGIGGGADQGASGQGGIGGAVYIDGISNNSAHPVFRVESCTFTGNGANDHGGAIFLYTYENSGSETLINNCTFHNNRITSTDAKVGFAGALYSQNGSLMIVSSTFDDNESVSMGGAVWHSSASAARIAGCTFSHNQSGNFGSALQLNGTAFISNCTLVNNICIGAWGGSIRTGTPDKVALKNCIFDSNQCATQSIGNISATCVDGGGNFQWPAGTDQVKVTSSVNLKNPLLGVLADNGGTTKTHLPLIESPVINGGTDNLSPNKDQRGYPRVGVCDSGSVEQ